MIDLSFLGNEMAHRQRQADAQARIDALLEQMGNFQASTTEPVMRERTPLKTVGAAIADAIFAMGRGINQPMTDFSGQLEARKAADVDREARRREGDAARSHESGMARMRASLEEAVAAADRASRERIAGMEIAGEHAGIEKRGEQDRQTEALRGEIQSGIEQSRHEFSMAELEAKYANEAELLRSGQLHDKDIQRMQQESAREIERMRAEIQRELQRGDFAGRADLAKLDSELNELRDLNNFEREKRLKELQADLAERGDERSQRLAAELGREQQLVTHELNKQMAVFSSELRETEAVRDYGRQVAMRGAELGVGDKNFSKMSVADQIQAINDSQYEANKRQLGEARANALEIEKDQGELAGRQLLNAYIDGDPQSGLPSLSERVKKGEDPAKIVDEFRRRAGEFRMRDTDTNRYIAELIGKMETEAQQLQDPSMYPIWGLSANMFQWASVRSTKKKYEGQREKIGDLR